MQVQFEIDRQAMQGVKPFTKIRGRLVTPTGKRKEITEFIGVWSDDKEIDQSKTRIKEQLACIK